jgi:hypothetical protein
MEQNERTLDDLRAELNRLREELSDIEDVHAFTFVKTSVHIGAEKAQNMQEEYDEECRSLGERIAAVERLIKEKESKGA